MMSPTHRRVSIKEVASLNFKVPSSLCPVAPDWINCFMSSVAEKRNYSTGLKTNKYLYAVRLKTVFSPVFTRRIKIYKWSCISTELLSSDHSKLFYTTLTLSHTFRHRWNSHQEQSGVQCFAKGHKDQSSRGLNQ